MANLYIMCGIPGAGKSTFLKNHINPKTSIVVSRDEIRFSILKPNEDYFSHEDEVCNIFWDKINKALAEGKDVFADQTSLTPRSRKWLLTHVHGYKYVNIVWIDESIETCIKINELRLGSCSYVPKKVIYNMYKHFIEPTIDEGFHRVYKYNTIKGLRYKGVNIK